jgi:hypothetical protein
MKWTAPFALVLLACSSSTPSAPQVAAGTLPVTLKPPDEHRASLLALDTDHVYWASDVGVFRVKKDGTGGEQIVLPDEGTVTGLAVDATHIYWSATGTGQQTGVVMTANKDGSHPLTMASQQWSPHAVTVDDAYLYWANTSNLTAAVVKLELTTWEISAVATQQTNPTEIASDESRVFWLDGHVLESASRANDGGPANAVQLTNTSGPIALSSGYVYLYDGESIVRIPKDTDQRVSNTDTAGVVLADSPSHIAVDATHIYWTPGDTRPGQGQFSRVMSAPISNRTTTSYSGAITTLATTQGAISALAVDSTGVYWADASGAIVRIPKQTL